MNWKFHTFIFVLVVVVFGSGKSLACSCQDPIASMTIEPSTYDSVNDKYYVCAGEEITFDASGSSDPDCESCSSCNGVSLVNGIRKFEWDWTNDSSYDETDEPGDGKATHEYEAGEYTVKLKVTDNDDDCCCSGTGCEDNLASKTYDIVALDVDKIEIEYDTGLWDDVTNGSIAVLAGTKYTFKATPDPDTEDWPSDQPEWEWDGDTEGTGETIDMTFDTAGQYILKAKFEGCSKQVTIDVIVPEIDEVEFVDAGDGGWNDIYDGDDIWLRGRAGRPGKNDPGCFVKDMKTAVKVKFWHEKNLSYATEVKVWGDVDNSYNNGENTTGGDYPEATMDFASWPSPSSGQVFISTGNIIDMVHRNYVNIEWEYKVLWGTNSPIDAGNNSNLEYFIVWDDPVCGWPLIWDGAPDANVGEFTEPNYTKAHLRDATNWGAGAGGTDPNDLLDVVCDSVQRASLYTTSPGYTVDGCWGIHDLPTGDCLHLACNMAYVARCLGVEANITLVNLKPAVNTQLGLKQVGTTPEPQSWPIYRNSTSGAAMCNDHDNIVIYKFGMAGNGKNYWQGCVYRTAASPVGDTIVWSPQGNHNHVEYWTVGNCTTDPADQDPPNEKEGNIFEYKWLHKVNDTYYYHESCSIQTSGYSVPLWGGSVYQLFDDHGN